MNRSRITINMDKELERKLRVVQASMIASTNGTFSFSKVIEFVLIQGLDKIHKKKKILVSHG